MWLLWYYLPVNKLTQKYHYSWIILKELVKTDFKMRYEGSVLGMLWTALKPLLLFTVMYVVFVHFLRFGAGIPYFANSLLLAIVLWTFFSEATGQGMRSIVHRGDVLRKINIPKYVIVVSTTASALVNLGINLVVVLIFAIISGVQFSWTALIIIPALIELFVFTLSISFLLSAIFVKFRDVEHIWDVFLQALFYATPIIYPIAMVMDFSTTAAKVLLLNPIAQLIQDARWGLMYQGTETIWNTIGEPLLWLVPHVIVIITLIISTTYFRKNSKYFAELV